MLWIRLYVCLVDYFGHIFRRMEGDVYTPLVLQYHVHMLSGVREKFAAPGSNREAAWQRLGVVPRELLGRLLDGYVW